jgi:hypothetical protein
MSNGIAGGKLKRTMVKHIDEFIEGTGRFEGKRQPIAVVKSKEHSNEEIISAKHCIDVL